MARLPGEESSASKDTLGRGGGVSDTGLPVCKSASATASWHSCAWTWTGPGSYSLVTTEYGRSEAPETRLGKTLNLLLGTLSESHRLPCKEPSDHQPREVIFRYPT